MVFELGRVVSFVSSIIGIGGGKLAIYVPKEVVEKVKPLRGRKVIVVVIEPDQKLS